MDDELLTLDQLARFLRLTRRAVDKRRAAGRLGIREINVGGQGKHARPRFRVSDVERYLKEREVSR